MGLGPARPHRAGRLRDGRAGVAGRWAAAGPGERAAATAGGRAGQDGQEVRVTSMRGPGAWALPGRGATCGSPRDTARRSGGGALTRTPCDGARAPPHAAAVQAGKSGRAGGASPCDVAAVPSDGYGPRDEGGMEDVGGDGIR